jgi:hypothetical protein
MSPLEKRVAELERKIEVWEQRRAKLIPPELADDPNVIELCADHVKSAVAGWRLCLKENGVSREQAKFLDAQRQALRELEQAAKEEKEREAARFCAAVQFYERTGQNPPGFQFVDEDFETHALRQWELPAGESEQ